MADRAEAHIRIEAVIDRMLAESRTAERRQALERLRDLLKTLPTVKDIGRDDHATMTLSPFVTPSPSDAEGPAS